MKYWINMDRAVLRAMLRKEYKGRAFKKIIFLYAKRKMIYI